MKRMNFHQKSNEYLYYHQQRRQQ